MILSRFVSPVLSVLVAGLGVAVLPSFGQGVPPNTAAVRDYEFTCPGSFPSDLAVVNCEYTGWQRLQDFAANGLTDKAILLSATGSIFTTAIRTPGEWPGTWKYYGYRVGASYTQSAGNAAAQLIVGALLGDDPRHVPCNRDPLQFGVTEAAAEVTFHCSAGRRVGHALLDSITVRKSYPGGLPPKEKAIGRKALTHDEYSHAYRRIPAISRLVGVYAGAYAQYPWEPRSANTFGAISQRAALSFAPTFLGSFWKEYSPSLFSHLKKARH